MRCAILSRKRSLHATSRLAEEGRHLGMKVHVYDTLRISAAAEPGNLRLLFRDKEMRRPDVVVPRVGASITSFGGCIMFQMEQMGIPLLNSSQGMFNSRDKLRSMQILSGRGIPIPRTMMLRRPSQQELEGTDALSRRLLFKAKVTQAVEQLGGTPVIAKLNRGTQGIGVILCQTMNDVFAQVDMLWKRREDFILQEFVREARGTDVRALVVGGHVVASMKRQNESDFRSNTHQGGTATAYLLPRDMQQQAAEATGALGLSVAGVDMLVDRQGVHKVIEVNSSPGFEGLERATGKNVAHHIMMLAREMARGAVRSETANG